ncbi:NUDIX domain-containing protein [Micromonospora saelicesensis]|uniref:NUDIX domain-containing protein n=1 Tax=Micromonospora saelicesensis TaxID=285676 RepID=UPI000DD9D1B3|nr:NUDIX domain-containing protein [Micromonospora saelicesensis]
MAKQSAGILVYKIEEDVPSFLLVHPGGPFWARKDLGSWSIPKGEFEDGSEPLAAALRELAEETGLEVDGGDLIELGSIKQKNGKVVHAWAIESEFDVSGLKSNTFEMEWPRGSGVMREYPEIDRAGWFRVKAAKEKALPAQVPLIDRLLERFAQSGRTVKLEVEEEPEASTLF